MAGILSAMAIFAPATAFADVVSMSPTTGTLSDITAGTISFSMDSDIQSNIQESLGGGKVTITGDLGSTTCISGNHFGSLPNIFSLINFSWTNGLPNDPIMNNQGSDCVDISTLTDGSGTLEFLFEWKPSGSWNSAGNFVFTFGAPIPPPATTTPAYDATPFATAMTKSAGSLLPTTGLAVGVPLAFYIIRKLMELIP